MLDMEMNWEQTSNICLWFETSLLFYPVESCDDDVGRFQKKRDDWGVCEMLNESDERECGVWTRKKRELEDGGWSGEMRPR